ncbi:SH3 domain-containing protein [Tabrizicola sp.]|uniref:SH3 domain-containing protein n=1 Tax=Tabrizicola sp. TaxID=2005166 RepID=UPI003F4188F7
MFRLTLILCFGMFATLMIAGEDRGQLRPGLAEAAAKKVLPGSELVAGADSVVPRVTATPAVDTATARPLATEAAAVARAEPEPYVEPEREVVTAVEEPIFSLSAVGNEEVPAGAESEPAPEALAEGEGTIWYVNADSVNVRAEPSTEAEILDRLGSGEATLMVQAVNDEWARIVIQGDGVEGFVALRYLSPEAP